MQEEFEDPQEQAIQWPNIDLQNTTQKTIFSPTTRLFYRQQTSDYLFFGHTKSVICLQIFIINFLLKTAEPIDINNIFASFRSINFVSLKFHHIFVVSEETP